MSEMRLNYIDSEKQEYCDVCLAELQGSKLKFADLDEDDDLEKTELCPVCGVNYMRFGDQDVRRMQEKQRV